MNLLLNTYVCAHTSVGARLAKLNTDAALDASSETVVLYPEYGNLHCFTATDPCVVLDVMAPPYCRDEGRDCAYYSTCLPVLLELVTVSFFGFQLRCWYDTNMPQFISY
jgi:hypothetical protein